MGGSQRMRPAHFLLLINVFMSSYLKKHVFMSSCLKKHVFMSIMQTFAQSNRVFTPRSATNI